MPEDLRVHHVSLPFVYKKMDLLLFCFPAQQNFPKWVLLFKEKSYFHGSELFPVALNAYKLGRRRIQIAKMLSLKEYRESFVYVFIYFPGSVGLGNDAGCDFQCRGVHLFGNLATMLAVHSKNIRRIYGRRAGNQLPVHVPLFIRNP